MVQNQLLTSSLFFRTITGGLNLQQMEKENATSFLKHPLPTLLPGFKIILIAEIYKKILILSQTSENYSGYDKVTSNILKALFRLKQLPH